MRIFYLGFFYFKFQLTYGSKFCFFTWPFLLPTFFSLWTSSLLLLCLDPLFPPSQLYRPTGTGVGHHFWPFPSSLSPYGAPSLCHTGLLGLGSICVSYTKSHTIACLTVCSLNLWPLGMEEVTEDWVWLGANQLPWPEGRNMENKYLSPLLGSPVRWWMERSFVNSNTLYSSKGCAWGINHTLTHDRSCIAVL